MTVTVDDFVQARWYYTGRQRTARLIVVHATQSPETEGGARGVANDFATRPSTNKASAHVVVDDAQTLGCVATSDTAFAVPSANADGFHIEQVGYSEQNPDEWQDVYSQKVIARAATAAREAADELSIPKVWLGPDEIAAGARGITDHNSCSIALGGTHWDPGPNYPRQQFMALVLGTPAPPKEDVMALDSAWVKNGAELWYVMKGTDSAVWARVFTRAAGTWGGWESLGGSVPDGGEVTVTGDPNGQVDVGVVGQDKHAWHRAVAPDGTQLPWEDLGGQAG